MVRKNVSGFILQLVTVFLLFDGNPQNLQDPSFRAYGCRTSLILRPGAASIPVTCTVWYDASAGRESEYYVETAQPRLGQVLMGCAFGFDRVQNRSDCVAPDFSPGSYKGTEMAPRGQDGPDVGDEPGRSGDVLRDPIDPKSRRRGDTQRPAKRR
jgi:hypothetical protein